MFITLSKPASVSRSASDLLSQGQLQGAAPRPLTAFKNEPTEAAPCCTKAIGAQGATGANVMGDGAGAGAGPKACVVAQGDGVVYFSHGEGVVPAINPSPYGLSTHGGVVGPAVVGGAGVVTGGGIVGAGVIFQRGGGPKVGKISRVISGRPGRPGSGFAGANGKGGGGPGSGGGGGGPGIGGCAGAIMVVVGAGVMNIGLAAAALSEQDLPVLLPWQLQP